MPSIIPFPALSMLAGGAPQDFSGWKLLANTRLSASVLTNATQVVERPGGRWTFAARFVAVQEPDRSALEAFFAALEGQANWFTVYDWSRRAARGTAATVPGSPVVNGGGQTGKLLVVSGAPPNQVGWLRAGDYFGVNGEVKRMTVDANTSAGGAVTLQFSPALRASPPAGSVITTFRPAATFVLTTPTAPGDNVRPVAGGRVVQDFALDAVEAWQP